MCFICILERLRGKCSGGGRMGAGGAGASLLGGGGWFDWKGLTGVERQWFPGEWIRDGPNP